MTETRAEEAQRLVDEGAIRHLVCTPNGAAALVLGDGEDPLGDRGHHIANISANGHFFCTCSWGMEHSHPDDLCAHALAVKLAVEREVGDIEA